VIHRPAILLTLLAITVSAQMPPPLPELSTNWIVRVSTNAVAARTNSALCWDAYTNVWFNLEVSTNLVDWCFFTNVPVWKTNLIVSTTEPVQFFRIKTCYAGR